MVTPCSKCNKRHTRSSDTGSVGGSGVSLQSPVTASSRHMRAFLFMASLVSYSVAFDNAPSHPVGNIVGRDNIQNQGNREDLGLKSWSLPIIHDVREVQAQSNRRAEVVNETEYHDVDHDEHPEEDHEDEHHDEVHDEEHHDEEHHDEDHQHEEDQDSHNDHVEELQSEVAVNEQEASKPWLPVVGATLLVNFATLTGLILMVVPAIRKGMLNRQSGEAVEPQSHGKLINIVIPSFAVGALMATAMFLVFPEALHLIEGAHADEAAEGDGHDHIRLLQEEHDHNEEGVAAAKLGCGMLGGFLLPVFLSIFFHRPEGDDEDGSAVPADEEECKSCVQKDTESGVVPQNRGNISTAVVLGPIVDNDLGSVHDADQDSVPVAEEYQITPLEPLPTKTFINYRLASAILIGDAFHNFADGLFIGAAFLGCSWATAWSITAVSLFHELAQELADFILLTRFVGFSVSKAFVLNFVSGLSVCIGGLTVLAAKPSDEAIGIILAFAGGVYVNIAACESLPRVERFTKDRTDRALTLVSIIVGTVPIGLILLDHKHC